MVFQLLDAEGKLRYKEQLRQLLEENDSAFVPPLSARCNTTQTDFQSAIPSNSGVDAYFGQMMKQAILAVLEKDELLGFVSFVENFTSDAIEQVSQPNIYISTVLVQSYARGKGVTKKAYDYLFNNLFPERSIYTRTWSTNTAHIKILSAFDFAEIKRIFNDRGEGIDTVYFARK